MFRNRKKGAIRVSLLLILLLFLASFSSLMGVTDASALTVPVGEGFFSYLESDGATGGFVLRNCDEAGRYALYDVWNASESNKKSTFINLIKKYYDGCGLDEGDIGGVAYNTRRNKIGSRYIILSMLGKRYVKSLYLTDGKYDYDKVADHNISSDLQLWENIMKQPSVTVANYSSFGHKYNTGFRKTKDYPNHRDVFRTNHNSSSDAIVIRQDGSIRYILRVDCANPLGETLSLAGPVLKDWSITPTVSIDKTTAYAGQTVTWTHTARNNGPAKTDMNVGITGVQIGVSGARSTVANRILASGTASGSSVSFDSTLTIPNTASVGDTYCRLTSASRKSNIENVSVDSSRACVTVITRPIDWSVSPSISINKTSADIGETVTWTHGVKNNGPTNIDKSVTVSALGDGDPNTAKTLASGSGVGAEISFESTFKIPTNARPGNQYCRRTGAQPRSYNNNNRIETAPKCVVVKYKYSLIPTINLGADIITQGQPINVTGVVKNVGPTVSHDVNWKIRVYKNETLLHGSFKSGNNEFNVGDNNLGSYEYSETNNLSFGDTICFSLWLSRKTHESIVPIESDPKCAKVGKIPKVQVWGGDIWADKKVAGARSFTSGKQFGSWAEYGVLSKSSILNFGSAGVMPENSAVNSCGFSLLSFTNFGCPDSIGGYSFNRVVPNIGNMFTNPSDKSENNLNLSALDGGVYELNSGDIINVDGGDIDVGKSIVLLASGKTVKIDGDIKYSGDTITDLNKIPQVVIVAKNIYIDENVTQVDAWLIAENEINTCYNLSFDEIKGNICNKQLKINGPIRAKNINLYRTYGSNNISDQGSPAEIINYRADAILWAINQSNNTNSGIPSIKSTYIIEQPVRF